MEQNDNLVFESGRFLDLVLLHLRTVRIIFKVSIMYALVWNYDINMKNSFLSYVQILRRHTI